MSTFPLGLIAALLIVPLVSSAEYSFVPMNADIFRMRTPEGEQLFVRDDSEENILLGEKDWIAERRGRQIVALSPEREGCQSGFLFADGRLVRRLQNGREERVAAKPEETGPAALKALWPKPENRLKGLADHAKFWADGKRLRMFYDNPNLFAALLAQLVILSLGLLFVRRYWVKAVGILLSLAFAVLLVMTESRAALLAVAASCALMMLSRIRVLLNWKVLLVLGLAVLTLVGVVAIRKVGSRFTTEFLEEGSESTSRLPILMEVPRMIADAPCGWGVGNSGNAYINWYQRENTCLVEHLVSGHATYLVEHGWVLRLAYCFMWAFVLLWLARVAFAGGNAMPMALWLTFAILGCLHPVIQESSLWGLPLAGVAVMFFSPMARKMVKIPAVLAVAISVCSVAGATVAGRLLTARNGQVPISQTGTGVVVGGDSAATWVVDDGYALHGGYWWKTGAQIRKWCAENPGEHVIGYARSLADVPADCARLVLVGEKASEFLSDWETRVEALAKLGAVVFLSPDVPATEIPEELVKRCPVSVIQGGLAVRRSGLTESLGYLKVIQGAELYIPGWLNRVTTK